MDGIGNTIGALLVIGVFVGLVVLAIRYRLKHPRFIIDERGERQRVDRWSRGQPVYTPKTWQQRIQEEATLNAKRRRALLASSIVLAGPGYVAYQAFTQGSFVLGAVAGPLILYVALPVAACWFLPNFLTELLYLSGYQGMQGAMVRDKAPKPAQGRDLVETQKAHGDARLAGEAEALALLNSRK